MIVVMRVGHPSVLHVVVTRVTMHRRLAVFHPLVGFVAMRALVVVIEIVRRCCAGKRQGNSGESSELEFHEDCLHQVDQKDASVRPCC